MVAVTVVLETGIAEGLKLQETLQETLEGLQVVQFGAQTPEVSYTQTPFEFVTPVQD